MPGLVIRAAICDQNRRATGLAGQCPLPLHGRGHLGCHPMPAARPRLRPARDMWPAPSGQGPTPRRGTLQTLAPGSSDSLSTGRGCAPAPICSGGVAPLLARIGQPHPRVFGGKMKVQAARLTHLECRQPDQRQNQRNDPEADHDLRLCPALFLEMMVDRGHQEHALSGLLEIRAPE